MTTKRYNLVNFAYNHLAYTEDDDLWASLSEPQVLWVIKQDPDKYVIEQLFAYEYENPSHPMTTRVYISFNDDRLETEYLLRFGNLNRDACT